MTYQVRLERGGAIVVAPNAAYDFGTDDFTLTAMIQSREGGTVIACKGDHSGDGNGGFLLVVEPDGSVRFVTDNGHDIYQAVSDPTALLDGACHTVAAIRENWELWIYVDGDRVNSTISGSPDPPLNVSNQERLTFGTTDQSREPHRHFVGSLMNVGLWRGVVQGDDLVRAAFGRVTGREEHLKGYWKLNNSGHDLSREANTALRDGPATFEPCFDCTWAEGGEGYAFCHIANTPEPAAAGIHTISRELRVKSDAQCLVFAIRANQDRPAFPSGATVELRDPAGQLHNRDVNIDDQFAVTSEGQLWGFITYRPAIGRWRVTVTAAAATGFSLYFQTITPTVIPNSLQKLEPIFGDMQGGRELEREGWAAASLAVKLVAVSAIVGVIAAGAAVILGSSAVTAIITGLVFFAAVGLKIANLVIHRVARYDSFTLGNKSMVGTAGLVVARDKLLIIDANVEADPATQLTYARREMELYSAVYASPFNRSHDDLVMEEMTRAGVHRALDELGSRYVTASGHGQGYYLYGWPVRPRGPLDEVLGTSGAARFTRRHVEGKIFHLLACHCGYPGSASSPGLGRAMVAQGAKAFFGYSDEFIIPVRHANAFIDCDIAIDLAMLAGETCEQAHSKAIGAFEAAIDKLLEQGYIMAVTNLRHNRGALVSPVTDEAYGDKSARLRID